MNYYNDSKITYQQLVMEQIKKIQDICSKELRDGDKILKNAMGEQIIEGDDTRYSFLQSVELLGSMLKPWFGKMMKVEDSDKDAFELFCDYYDIELIEILDDEDFWKVDGDGFWHSSLHKDLSKVCDKSKKLNDRLGAYRMMIKTLSENLDNAKAEIKWKTAQIESMQNKILDLETANTDLHNEAIQIENHTCEGCKYYNSMNESSGLCEQEDLPPLGIDNDFGCNKWEKK